MEIEFLEQQYDSFNAPKKIKDVTGGNSLRTNNTIMNMHYKLLNENKKVFERWKDYMGEFVEEEY